MPQDISKTYSHIHTYIYINRDLKPESLLLASDAPNALLHTYIHIHTHTYIHTDTHTHTHKQRLEGWELVISQWCTKSTTEDFRFEFCLPCIWTKWPEGPRWLTWVICVCVCMYVCMYVWVCVCVYVCLYVCKCTSVCVFTCMYVLLYIHAHINTSTRAHTHT